MAVNNHSSACLNVLCFIVTGCILDNEILKPVYSETGFKYNISGPLKEFSKSFSDCIRSELHTSPDM